MIYYSNLREVALTSTQNKTWSLAVQEEFVKNSTFALSPGEAFPTESPRPDPTAAGGYSTPTPTSSTTTSPSTGSQSSGHSTLSGGAIAGIAIGGAAVVILAAALLYVCGRKGGIEKGYRRSHIHQAPPAFPVGETKYGTPGSPPPASTYDPPGSESYRSGAASPQWGRPAGSPPMSYDQRYSSPRAETFTYTSPQLDQSHRPY
jgi:hypothetical protein